MRNKTAYVYETLSTASEKIEINGIQSFFFIVYLVSTFSTIQYVKQDTRVSDHLLSNPTSDINSLSLSNLCVFRRI